MAKVSRIVTSSLMMYSMLLIIAAEIVQNFTPMLRRSRPLARQFRNAECPARRGFVLLHLVLLCFDCPQDVSRGLGVGCACPKVLFVCRACACGNGERKNLWTGHERRGLQGNQAGAALTRAEKSMIGARLVGRHGNGCWRESRR
jgi:hypothetical protein